MLYLNNAATSYPKPPEVLEAVARALREPPQDPGRTQGGVDSAAACRQVLGSLLGVPPPYSRVALLPSATYALNAVVQGLLRNGDHVVTSCCEHNSLLRPLAHLGQSRGLQVSFLGCDPAGETDLSEVDRLLQTNTRLLALCHASNVTGAIQPIERAAELCANRGIALLIDAAQSAGCVPLDASQLPGKVYVVLAGHKGLLGPTGTGVLVVPDDSLLQTVVGGTGVRSQSELHPGDLPLRHEAGTPNLCGLAGLAAGATWVLNQGLAALGERRQRFVRRAREGLARIPGLQLLPLAQGDGRVGIISFRKQGWRPEDLAFVLANSFGIETRAGLLCAPLLHKTLGTSPEGTVRVSAGVFTSEEDADTLIAALERVGGA